MNCLYGYGVMVLTRRFHLFPTFIMSATAPAETWSREGGRRDHFRVHDFRHARFIRRICTRRYIEHSRGWTHKRKSTIGTKRCFVLLLLSTSVCMCMCLCVVYG